MSRIEVNGIELAYDDVGQGEPLVLVHGSWSDRSVWEPVVAQLAELGRVISYDRRGHGESVRPARDATRRDHEDDLAALIEAAVGEPATVIGTSFGGSIALGTASRRPDLVRALAVHEPPLVSWAPDEPGVARELELIGEAIGAVLELIATGDPAGAAKRFVEEVALGPGAWELMPNDARRSMVAAAPTFATEQRDPGWALLPSPEAIDCPTLLTLGSASPGWFHGITEALREAIGDAEVRTLADAGHAPHTTHPATYVEVIASFLSREPAIGPA